MTRQALISDKWLSKVPFTKIRCTDFSGDLQWDIASGLRLGQPPPCLSLLLLFGYKGQQTIYKALVQCDGSLGCCHFYHISACPLPSSWGSGKDDWCKAYGILWASLEKYKMFSLLSSSQNARKCFHTVLHARTDPVFSIGLSAYVNPSSWCWPPSSFLKELKEQEEEFLH